MVSYLPAVNILNMPSAFLKKLHYIVTLGFTIELPGPDERFVEVVGTYESLDDAKRAVEANAGLISDNDKQFLTIHKVDLEACKVFDFYRKDLKTAVEAAQRRQREQEAQDYIKAIQLAEKKKQAFIDASE